jgi:ABC-type antimicrobial peptide transport system permease subunit
MLLGVLALLGIGLAAAGVYGVMSHVVTLQAAEISIRLSLGATRGAVLRRVLADAVVNTSVGVILGLLAGVAFAQLLQSLLFGVTPLDPATFSAAAGLVIVAAVLAALAPALTAMRIDPAEALRQS